MFQNSNDFELLVEYYEDLFASDPRASLQAVIGEDGEGTFEGTGDPLIDKWEKELAMGIDPDLSEGLSKEAREELAVKHKKRSVVKEQLNQLNQIDENYDDPKYKSKFVTPGTAEEKSLLNKGTLGQNSNIYQNWQDKILGKK